VPVCVIGSGLREDVLFYLGRTVPVIRNPERFLAAASAQDYRGYAIVTVDAYPDLQGHGDEVTNSTDRPAEQDRLVLMRFPKSATVRSPEPER
jgi:hypothetical protein